MGLFGGDDTSITQVDQTYDTTNVSISDVDGGIALAGVRDSEVHITETDQGAVDAAVEIATRGIDASEGALREVVGLGRDVIDAGAAQNERTALIIAEGQAAALGFAGDTQAAAIDFVDDLAGRSLDAVSDISDTFLEFTSGQSTNLLNAIENIQARESVNTDARLEEITRVALIGAGVVAVGAIAFAAFGGK